MHPIQPAEEPEIEAQAEQELAEGAEQVLPGTLGSPLAALPPLGGTRNLPAAAPSEIEAPCSPSALLPPLMPAGSGYSSATSDARISVPSTPASPGGENIGEELPGAGGWPFDSPDDLRPLEIDDVIGSLEDLPPLSEVGDISVPDGFANIDNPPTDRQVTLRGLFLCEGEIDADRVAQFCSDLPGIESCVVLGSAGALHGGSSEAAEFEDEAARLHACLLDLVTVAGVGESESFTIRTDRNMVSFFSGDGLALAVRHGAEGFQAGVRERLAIIARELGNLANQVS
jgi:hypothetical protein